MFGDDEGDDLVRREDEGDVPRDEDPRVDLRNHENAESSRPSISANKVLSTR